MWWEKEKSRWVMTVCGNADRIRVCKPLLSRCPVHPSFPPPAARLRLKLLQNMTLNEKHLPLTGHVSIDFSPQRRQSAWQNLLRYRLKIIILNCNQGHIRLDCAEAKHNLCLTPRRHSQNSTICTTKSALMLFFLFFLWEATVSWGFLCDKKRDGETALAVHNVFFVPEQKWIICLNEMSVCVFVSVCALSSP